MKLVLIGILLASFQAKADVIVSVAVKQTKTVSSDTTTTNSSTTTVTNETTNTVTNNCNKNGKHCTSTSTSSTTSSSSGPYTSSSSATAYGESVSNDVGLLVQYVSPNYNVVLGLGYFQDNTGMATIGYRFK